LERVVVVDWQKPRSDAAGGADPGNLDIRAQLDRSHGYDEKLAAFVPAQRWLLIIKGLEA
jgi:hypothetical protein